MRAAPPDADDEPLALQTPESVANGCQADAEAGGEILEPEALAGCKPEAADLMAEDAVDAVLDGRNLERRRVSLIFDL